MILRAFRTPLRAIRKITDPNMCAIAGIFDLKASRDIAPARLAAMTDAMVHRGPDGDGAYIGPGIALGHRRLAIIDLAGGHQPFHAEGGRGVLTYNGEIYNYQDLSRDLESSGFRPRTRSDTEVIAEGMARAPDNYFRQLNGMFAFGFFDPAKQSLTLVRDRLGEKPLYYSVSDDGYLIFASEINALFASGLLSRQLEPTAIADYFFFGYVPDPKTIYRGIFKLPPGHCLTADRHGRISINAYWRPDLSVRHDGADPGLPGELIERLDQAVSRQMMSDVPLGAFLSGGVDSAAIVSSMSLGGGVVTACTIGFAHEHFDERPYARNVAALYGARHVESEVEIDALSLIDTLAVTYGEPFADSSALPTYLVCAAARQHVTVALSGDGGDELFAGYRRYPFFQNEEDVRARLPAGLRAQVFSTLGQLYPKLDRAPRPLRLKTTLLALGLDSASAYGRAVAINLPERIERMLSGDFRASLKDYQPADILRDAMRADHVRQTPLGRAQAGDLATWLPGRMLVKIDRAAMANSLEVRPPLLDHDFADWAFGLPDHVKLKGHSGKHIFKQALRDRLPDDILFRRKQGFGLPMRDWLADRAGPASRLEASHHWRDSGLFDQDAVMATIDQHRKGAIDAAQDLWSLIMFDAFLQNMTPEARLA